MYQHHAIIMYQSHVSTLLRSGKNINIKLLEKVIGLSVHLSQTVFGAKMFYRNMNDVLTSLKNKKNLTAAQMKGVFHDLRFWLTQATKHDGTSIIAAMPAITNIYLATDAALATGNDPIIGIGYFYNGLVLSITALSIADFLVQLHHKANALQKKHKAMFPFRNNATQSHNIAYLELFAVWWLVSSHVEEFKNRYLPLRIDNSNALAWLYHQSAPPPYLVILRPLVELMRLHNIRFYPTFTKSVSNKLADAASRNDWLTLNKLLPNWKNEVDTTLHCPLPEYMKPGPLFLWTHGYFGRKVPEAWNTPVAELDDTPLA